jgi:hypothetical protein
VSKLHISGDRVSFICPGCNGPHTIIVKPLNANGWEWNQDSEKPTFTPSIKVTGYNDEEKINFCCHSVITDGKIRFEDDCTHWLKGKTVELPDWDERYG